jgi:hypothetical protein
MACLSENNPARRPAPYRVKPLSFRVVRAVLPVLLWLWGAAAAAQGSDLPSELVLRIDPSAAKFDQAQIRAALARELGVPLADAGSAAAPTLTVRLTDGGDLELIYDPERRRITRSAPLTQSTVVPELIANLAGNMVRDEASMLIADLQTEPHAPATTVAPATPVVPPHPETIEKPS